MPDGDGPIEDDFGPGVVRLPVGETVWGRRIDPARMVLLSVPLPESGFRCGDVVLHDGVPVGERVVQGEEFSVFDLLARWRASDVPTTEVLVDAAQPVIDALTESLTEREVVVEKWSSSIQLLCAACSRGRVDYEHPDHDHDHDHGHDPSIGYTRIGCSGDPDEIAALVASWDSETDGVVQAVRVH